MDLRSLGRIGCPAAAAVAEDEEDQRALDEDEDRGGDADDEPVDLVDGAAALGRRVGGSDPAVPSVGGRRGREDRQSCGGREKKRPGAHRPRFYAAVRGDEPLRGARRERARVYDHGVSEESTVERPTPAGARAVRGLRERRAAAAWDRLRGRGPDSPLSAPPGQGGAPGGRCAGSASSSASPARIARTTRSTSSTRSTGQARRRGGAPDQSAGRGLSTITGISRSVSRWYSS